MLAKQAPLAHSRTCPVLPGPSCPLHNARRAYRFQSRRCNPIPRASATEEKVYSVAMPELPSPASGKFTADWTSFTEEHRIRGYEVGPDQRATIVSMANLLQEIAANHAVALWGRSDQGFANLPSLKEFVFVMTRLQVQMDAYPKWGDIVRLETYFQVESKLSARRDWVITDPATGAKLGCATSTWVAINLSTRRLVRLPDETRDFFRYFEPKPRRHAVPEEQTRAKLPDLEEPMPIVGPVQVARRSDMDMNGHINNVCYIAWALETVPQEVYNSCTFRELTLDFKAECQAGDTVESLAAQQDALANGNGTSLRLLHTLRRCDKSGCVELVRATTKWAPRQ